MPLRAQVEHRANPLIARVNRLPRIVPFLVVLALLAVGIFVPTVGFVATAIVALLVAFLVYYTWPRLTAPEKMMRIAVLFIVVALTVVQAVPR